MWRQLVAIAMECSCGQKGLFPFVTLVLGRGMWGLGWVRALCQVGDPMRVGGTLMRRIVAFGWSGLVFRGLTWVYTARRRSISATLGIIGEVLAFWGINQNGRLATIQVYVEDVLRLIKGAFVGWRTGQFFVFWIREKRMVFFFLRYSLWLFWNNLDKSDWSGLIVLFQSDLRKEYVIKKQRRLKRTFVALKIVASNVLQNKYNPWWWAAL